MARDTSQDRRTIQVSIYIISKIPALPSLFCKRRRSFKYDEHATIFADRSHDLDDGSLCRLSVGNKEIPVILRLIDNEERNPIEVDASVPVYLSPCLAASLGLHWFQIRQKRTSACLEIMNDYSTVVEASHANVKEIGKLPPSPSFSSDFCDEYADSNTQQTNSNEDDAGLKQFFMYPAKLKNQTSSKPLKPKPRQRLLTLGSIFATLSRDENSNHVRFYKVVGIQSLIQQEDVPSQHCSAFYVSPSTHLTLAPSSFESNDGLECRLPRPSMGASYLQSIQHAKNMFSNARGDLVSNGFENGGEKTTIFDASSVETIHHPSTNAVANALYLLGASSTTNNVCSACRKLFVDLTPKFHPQFIHIIGGEDNHVSACVAEAADVIGMRYFRVDGLAAFWAHYNYLESYVNQADENSNRMLTGQLNDKLQGLAAALKIACNSSPCVLHVVDIDEELLPTTGHGADTDGWKEEEQRILQVIHEAVLRMSGNSISQSYIGSHKPSLKNSQDSSSLAAAPRLAVVFSGSTPLPSGPLISSLEQNSICLSTPNVDYARHLWDNNSDDTFALVLQMLMGLSASDIVFLRKKFVRRWNAEEEESRADDSEQLKSSAVSVMKSLLADLECTKAFTQTTSSSGNSSTAPLSSTSLPNVRWEDIGGLSSVREEIMDAVELPLNYPELFEGSRRSGILLFGPPGTGKTLVAKAVARECGIPFLSIKGPELLGSYVGESEANVRAVFEAARSAAASAVKPHTSDSGFESGRSYGGASVLFFDELDSLAPRRGDTGHGDGVMERVVATLLGELDRGTGGSEDRATKASKSNSPSPHVIVIGATNRPDLLDPSLLRPGRFDRLLYLGPANTKEACLQILLAQTRMFQFQDCDRTAVLGEAMKSFPPTLSGADLSAVASGALIRALKRVCDNVEKEVQRINTSRGVDDKSDEAVDVYDVMDSWSDKQLQPIVLEEDFVHAAKDIVPSISEEDLKRFEVLRNQFSVL